MKISLYNRNIQVGEKLYVFNSVTRALAEVDDSFIKTINDIKTSSREPSDAKLLKQMAKGGYIVEDGIDEIHNLQKQFNKRNHNISVKSFTIVPTFKCNFSCPYCYEVKNGQTMNIETAKNVIEFIKKSAHGSRAVYISWYGGEPLMAIDIISYISENLMTYFNSQSIEYSSAMVTNGYFVSEDVVKDLKRYNIKSCQITLDGIAATHNRKRFDKETREPSFDKIINNIKILHAEGIKVTLRFNIDKQNYMEMDSLLDYLKNSGLQDIPVTLGWLMPITDACSHIKDKCLTYEEYCLLELKIMDSKIKHGFAKSYMDFYPLGSECCSVSNEHSVVINPNGNLFKCWNDIDNNNLAVGNIMEIHSLAEIGNSKYSSWSPFVYEKCVDCDVFPICKAGCAYIAYKDGMPQCSKWKYILDEYIKRVILEKEVK